MTVRQRYAARRWCPAQRGDDLGWARAGGLAIPTWLYGHEPANLFAGRIAKYFSNAIREDTILRLARGGIVFAPGRAGTVQEVFQAATKTYYGTDGASGAYVFLDRAYWTPSCRWRRCCVRCWPRRRSATCRRRIHLTDDVREAVRLLTALTTTAGPPRSGEPAVGWDVGYLVIVVPVERRCSQASTTRAARPASAALPQARGSYCFLLPTSPSIFSTPS